MNYSPEQTLAIEATESRVGVIAGAGSGKTAVLVERARGMECVTIFSLTNSSVNQIKSRLDGNPTVTVTTVHGFCYKIVCENAEALGFSGPPTVIDDEEKDMLIKQCRSELGYDKCALKYIEYACDGKLQYLADYPKRNEALQVSQEFRNRLMANNQTTYHRLVLAALRALTDNKEKYHSLYANIMIDEAQDIDKTLWKIIDVLNPETIFAVGDPRQAIFGFRGGDAAAFERFCNLDGKDSENVTKVYYLTENYRSAAPILDYANALFPSLPQMGAKSDRNGDFVSFSKESVSWLELHSEKRIFKSSGEGLADYKILDAGWDTRAILCPTNHELDALETELTNRGIAFQRLRGQPKVTEGMRIVRAFMRVRVNPWDEMAARICIKYIGNNADDAIRHKRSKGAAPGDGLYESQFCTTDPLQFDEDGMAELERITNYRASGNTIESYLLESSRGLIDGAERETLDPAKVTLATIHLAKGREFDHVYISTDGIRDTIEGRRAFYVAVTRAKYSVTICTNGKPVPEFVK